MRFQWSLAVVMMLGGALQLHLPPAAAAGPTTRAAAVNPAGMIGAGDLVEVATTDLLYPGRGIPLLTRVNARGELFVPLVGAVHVGPVTTDQAAAAVAAAYRKANVINNGVVTVAINQKATSRPAAIAPGDTVQIVLFDARRREPEQLVHISETVGADGTVELPDLGKVKLAGSDERDAPGAITQARLDAKSELVVLSVVRTDGQPVRMTAPAAKVSRGAKPLAASTSTTRLAAGDLLEIEVDDVVGPGQRLTFPGRLDRDGVLTILEVGDVKLAGLTPADADAALLAAYRRATLHTSAVAVTLTTPAAAMDVPPGPFAVGDTARIVVFDLGTPAEPVEVHAMVATDGTVILPLVGPIRFAGLNEVQAVAAVRKAYADHKVVDQIGCIVLRTGATK